MVWHWLLFTVVPRSGGLALSCEMFYMLKCLLRKNTSLTLTPYHRTTLNSRVFSCLGCVKRPSDVPSFK